jgi:1-deoxy-D-xylulose-5-phosphate reductoisomerase
LKNITILGATGTIGINTLDVIKRHPDDFKVIALTAHRQVDRLATLCLEWSPRYAVMADSDAAARLEQRLKKNNASVQVLSGFGGGVLEKQVMLLAGSLPY